MRLTKLDFRAAMPELLDSWSANLHATALVSTHHSCTNATLHRALHPRGQLFDHALQVGLGGDGSAHEAHLAPVVFDEHPVRHQAVDV